MIDWAWLGLDVPMTLGDGLVMLGAYAIGTLISYAFRR